MMPGKGTESLPDLEAANLSSEKHNVIRRRPFLSKTKSRLTGQAFPRLELEESSASSGFLWPASSEDVYTCAGKLRRLTKRNARRCGILSSIEQCFFALATIIFLSDISVHRVQQFRILGFRLWRWCIMVVVVFCSRVVTGWVINIIFCLMETSFLRKKKALYFFHGVKESFQICIGLISVFAFWNWIFRNNEHSVETMKTLDIISRFLLTLLIGALIWLVKTLAIKFLASFFHAKAFFVHMQESIIDQYILQVLSGQPTAQNMDSNIRSRPLSMVKQSKRKRKDLGSIDVLKLDKLDSEKVSKWTIEKLISAVRTSIFLTLSNMIDNMSMEEATDESEAKAAACMIFENVAKSSASHIQEEDLSQFFTKKELELVLLHFEGALKTGKIEKSAFIKWVVKAYNNRKSLAYSLNDMKTVVKHLHRLTSMIALVINIVISLYLMDVTTEILSTIVSIIPLLAFAFGNTLKNTVNCIIFLLSDRPFNVGDRVVIDDVEMTVEEMSIRTTIFLKAITNEKIYYPNILLATKAIHNMFHTSDMSDKVLFSVDFSTPPKNIRDLKARINLFIESKTRHWRPNHSLVVRGGGNVNKLNLALHVTHEMNFKDIAEKNMRRAELLAELEKIFGDLSICYCMEDFESSNPDMHSGHHTSCSPSEPVTTERGGSSAST